ncbi:MAG TPA: YidC/Oxa1 family membrane protein insertase [Thermomicrobiales bacterium]|nr:YidC/Oxa1 family membrane protein insertase [Thermomicrobiales bacterium]
MLFDLPGLVALSADHMAQMVSTLVPGIILWDQYVDFVEWVLAQLGSVFNSGGLAIIAFTIIIKTLLLPLTVKSIRSSKAMQELAPKIKELQKKHGADRQKASAETMALYQQYGVNPMAGCLPMLIQMPIFFGVYFGIREMSGSGAEEWANGFLWLDSLKEADPLHLLPILAGFFQFIQTRMMRPANQKITDPQQQIMNTMMTFMPLTVVLFGWGFDSGPVLYWVVQAIYSVVQQWLITGWGSMGEWFPWLPELPEHRRLGYATPRDPNDLVVMSGEGAAAQRSGFQGWLAKRMEEAQQNAQARQESLREQGKANGGKKAPANGTSDEVIETTATPTKQSSKRSGYQARVDAASKYRAAGSSKVVESSTASADAARTRVAGAKTTNPARPRKKKKQRA